MGRLHRSGWRYLPANRFLPAPSRRVSVHVVVVAPGTARTDLVQERALGQGTVDHVGTEAPAGLHSFPAERVSDHTLRY